MYEQIVDRLVSELRALIRDLGKDGGLISPSIYDTSRVLCLYPPDDVNPALDWLASQQQADGGWGDAVVPSARDVPTLAAVLALHKYRKDKQSREAIDAGLRFLEGQAEQWGGELSDDIPVAIELILPSLIEEAIRLGLHINLDSYKGLIQLSRLRHQIIANLRPTAGTTPVFSWEAWGTQADRDVVDGWGSVGHSPAATAAWLKLASKHPDLHITREYARQYLLQAGKSTECGIPGTYPTAWPITRFEQAFSSHALLLAGLLNFPPLQDVIQPQLQTLSASLSPDGLGFSDLFTPDGDNTAAALSTLHAAGYSTHGETLRRFERKNNFAGYPGELQSSITVTARSTIALMLQGKDVRKWQEIIIQAQNPDGSWGKDKWNYSPMYSTLLSSYALQNSLQQIPKKRTLDYLISHQSVSGSWGSNATCIETAFGLIALQTLTSEVMFDDNCTIAAQKARQWLLNHYHLQNLSREKTWLNKELYRPERIDRVFITGAFLASILHQKSICDPTSSTQFARISTKIALPV